MRATPTGGTPIRAVIFDLDGTLLTTGGAGAIAWSRAFEEIHDTPVDIEQVTESGMTDPEVAHTALTTVLDREPTGDDVARITSRYLRFLPEAIAKSERYEVKPGVISLLERLAGSDLLIGLTTGNVEPAARIKLERGDLNRFFTFGGFGSDSGDRTELTRIAIGRGIERASGISDRAATVGKVSLSDFIAVGDTPRDVLAAHGAGIRVAAVATGLFNLETLEATNPDWALATVESGFPI